VNARARRCAAAALLVLAALAGGCATVGTGTGTAPEAAAPSKADPWESFNRKVYAFNDAVDEAVLKPVATAYRNVVPQLVRTGVDNFFGNIGDAWSAVNHLLQGKIHHGLDMGMRVMSNTFFGLGGILDPATEFGLVRRSEDFGQTLGKWGVGTGPYLVLPFLGPSTLRDGVALVADRQVSASGLATQWHAGTALTLLEVVNLRANLLGATQVLDAVALDRYSFLRQAYLARRLDQVTDGAPQEVKFEDDLEDPEPPAPKTAPK
jgi:phospholipid-binding lipoprotein MlaA